MSHQFKTWDLVLEMIVGQPTVCISEFFVVFADQLFSILIQQMIFELKVLSVLPWSIELAWNCTPWNTSQTGMPETILNAVSQTYLLVEIYFCEISFMKLCFSLSRLSTNKFW